MSRKTTDNLNILNILTTTILYDNL